MSLWNAASGPSIHAELIGREWVKMGHTLRVFAPIEHPDSRPVDQKDEDFVIRHYIVKKVKPYTREEFFDPVPVLDYEMDIFMAENLERLPLLGLKEIFPKIKQKAKTVLMIHEGDPPKDPMFYSFDFDAIVCMDERYKKWLKKYFPENKIHIIPHPAHPWKTGNKIEKRKKLNLPLNKKIILTYGWRHEYIEPILEPLKKLSEKYPLMFLIIASPAKDVFPLLRLKDIYNFVEIRIDAPGIDKLYDYLHACDILLFYRKNLPYSSVISSSVYLTLGSGIPVVFSDINMVEKNGKEVLKYKTPEEMLNIIEKIFVEGYDVQYAKSFVEKYSSEKIASKFIDLFKKLIKKEA